MRISRPLKILQILSYITQTNQSISSWDEKAGWGRNRSLKRSDQRDTDWVHERHDSLGWKETWDIITKIERNSAEGGYYDIYSIHPHMTDDVKESFVEINRLYKDEWRYRGIICCWQRLRKFKRIIRS